MILVGGAVIGSLRNLKIFAIVIHNIVNKLLPGASSFVLCLHGRVVVRFVVIANRRFVLILAADAVVVLQICARGLFCG